MNRLKNFSFILFFTLFGLQLNAMEPIVEAPVDPAPIERPVESGSERYNEEYGDLPSGSNLNENPSQPPSSLESFGFNSNQEQPSSPLQEVNRDALTSSNIGAGSFNQDPLTESQLRRGLGPVSDGGWFEPATSENFPLDQVRQETEDAQQLFAQKQKEHQELLNRMDEERQGANNAPVVLSPEQQQIWGGRIARAERLRDSTQGKVAGKQKENVGLKNQIDAMNKQLKEEQKKLTGLEGSLYRKGPQYKVDELRSEIRNKVRKMSSQRDRLKIKLKKIETLEVKAQKAQTEYENLLNEAGVARKEEQESERQALIAQGQQEVENYRQVAEEKQRVYESLLSQAQEEWARIESDRTQREQLQSDWQEAQSRMASRKQTRAEQLAKDWGLNLKEKAAERKASEQLLKLQQEEEREQLAKESLRAAEESSERRQQQEYARVESEDRAKFQAIQDAMEQAEQSAQDASIQRQQQEDERVASEEQERLNQLQADWQEAQNRMAARKEEQVKKFAKKWANIGRENLKEKQETARIEAQKRALEEETQRLQIERMRLQEESLQSALRSVQPLPRVIQEESDIASFISSSDTQRTLVNNYLGLQIMFVQQAASAQAITTAVSSAGQSTPAQTAQLTATVQNLTAQGQQLTQEQQQARKDVNTLKNLNEEVIQRLDAYLTQLGQEEQTPAVVEKIAQIKAYQAGLVNEQKSLDVYQKSLDNASIRNKEIIQSYTEKLDDYQEQDNQSDDVIINSPENLEPEEPGTLENEGPSDEDSGNEEDLPEVDDFDEEKECGNNMKEAMNLGAELASIIHKLYDQREALSNDSQTLRARIQNAVEVIIGNTSTQVEDFSESTNSFDGMENLIKKGKESSQTSEVFDEDQRENLSSPFNRIGNYLRLLDKTLALIRDKIQELEEDDPQDSDKPICQMLARTLNTLSGRVNKAQKILDGLREQNSLNLDLINMTS